MPIDFSLGITDARRLLKLLDGSGEFPNLCDRLRDDLVEHDQAKAAKGPFRKVIRSEGNGIRRFDILECGHSHMRRQTKNWMEDDADRRRCQRCAPAQI
jgi:hypothetical protein